MENLEKYKQIFCEIFSLPENFDVDAVKMNETEDWDSVGHMDLITALEDAFDIMMEAEDIMHFISYQVGIEILKKYGVKI